MSYKGSIEPKLDMEQQVFKPLLQKFYKYKVTSCYPSDRNSLAQVILDADDEAIIKFCGNWTFKVKTRLNYKELFNLLIHAENNHYNRPRMADLKKVWWF